MEGYLACWQAEVDRLGELIRAERPTVIVGRGASLAAVSMGALAQKEAARTAVEGMHAAEFRHGPLELADARLQLIVLEGPTTTRDLNLRLAAEVAALGAAVLTIGPEGVAGIPQAWVESHPALEVLPLQLLSLALARQGGHEPGVSRRLEKVTRRQ